MMPRRRRLFGNADVHQSSDPQPTTHSDWWKRVPACLTSPLPRWKGLPPAGLHDPAWLAYQSLRVAHVTRVMSAFAEQFGVKSKPGSARYDREMLAVMLGMFPAFEVVRETRGAKQDPNADQESIARRKRSRSRKADK
jgi:hypothetical protein